MNAQIPDPYRPPSSALPLPPERPSRRIGWRIYLWVWAQAYPLVFLFSGVDWVQPSDLVDLATTATGLVGLFGYAYRRRLASERFWRRWLPVQIAWDLLAALWLVPLGWMQQVPALGPPPGSAELALLLLVLLPLYYALFRYGFRSPEVWQRS